MTHTIYTPELQNEIIIDETLSENVCIQIVDHLDGKNRTAIYLNPKQLHDFIGTLLHVQSKKRNKNG